MIFSLASLRHGWCERSEVADRLRRIDCDTGFETEIPRFAVYSELVSQIFVCGASSVSSLEFQGFTPKRRIPPPPANDPRTKTR